MEGTNIYLLKIRVLTRFTRDAEATKLELASFSGIHGHLSNKARFYKLGKWFFPSYFTHVSSVYNVSIPGLNSVSRLPDPFDRHDWIVRRPRTGQEARYVIDYYGIKHPRRETKLVIDARPALNSFDNARMRVLALIGRMFFILGAATTRVPHEVGGPAVKYGMCLLVIGISVYLSISVSV